MTTPQRAQDDDSDPNLSHPICTTQDAIIAATQYADAPEQEWLCVLSLSASREIASCRVVYGHETCLPPATPKDVIETAIMTDAVRLISVRFHPHQGPLPLAITLPWVEEVSRAAQACHLPYNHISCYADGYVFDFSERISYLGQMVGAYLPLVLGIAGLILQ